MEVAQEVDWGLERAVAVAPQHAHIAQSGADGNTELAIAEEVSHGRVPNLLDRSVELESVGRRN
jgi:hypothetical protein